MNFNSYFFLETPKGYSQYPDNYSKDIILGILAQIPQEQNLSQFAITRHGKLAYLTYLYRFSNTQCFGICMEYNDVIPTNFNYLLKFFDSIIVDILNKGEILYYDQSGTIHAKLASLSNRIDLLNYYSNYIHKHLNNKEAKFIALPAQNYTSVKKSIIKLPNNDDQVNLTDYLAVYDNIVISDENPYVMGYAKTLELSNDKIKQLKTELTKIKRQKNQYRIVILLILAIAGCLTVLISYNNDIHSLNGTITERNSTIDNLNLQLTDANEQIDTLTNAIITKDTHINSLQILVQDYKYSIDSLQTLIETKDKCLSNLNDTLTTTKSLLSGSQKNLAELQRNLNQAKQNLSDYKKAVSKNSPLIITDIEIANKYSGGRVETDFGGTIYSKNSMFIAPRIKYIGLAEGLKKLLVKLRNPKGTLITSATSSDYSFADDIYVFIGENERELSRFGNDTKGNWKKGTYQIEIWMNDKCLSSKSFTIY